MAVAKIYNSQTGQWEAAITGATGATGAAGSDGALSPNYIINGAMDFDEREGPHVNLGSVQYDLDRWASGVNGSGTDYSIEQAEFSEGELEALGFGDAGFFRRSTITTAGSMTVRSHFTKIEDVRTLAGQIVTLSFWAKADTNRTLTSIRLEQAFGAGGSGTTNTNIGDQAITSSWQRYEFTTTLPSISGETIGTNNSLNVYLRQEVADGSVLDLWGVQLEAGAVATPFKRHAPDVGLEKLACQRYFVGSAPGASVYSGFVRTSTTSRITVPVPVVMRANPSLPSNITSLDRLCFTQGDRTSASYTVLDNGQNQVVIEATHTTETTQRPMVAVLPNLTLDAEL